MLNIMPGQRWISTAEPELGLGTILRADARQSDIIFTGCGELKHFTHASSPLLRVRFDIGDSIRMDGDVRTVDAVTEDSNGTLSYCCAGESLHEGRVPSTMPPICLNFADAPCKLTAWIRMPMNFSPWRF
jgi:ATP-dependent helicase HepA